MRPLALEEIADRATYEALRPAFRDEVIALKARRRVAVGDRVTLVFENRETLRFQVQEMCRVEHIDDPRAVQHELDTYNELMPGRDQLSATLFIEIPERARIRPELDRLIGIDEHVALQVGDDVLRAEFDPKQMEEDRISAVQYIRFSLTPEQERHFANPSVSVHLRIDHPNYTAEVALPAEARESLAADLRGECEPLLPPEKIGGGMAARTETLTETARVRVVWAGPGHRVVEPREPLPAGSLLGANDEPLTLEIWRTVEAQAREIGAGGVPVEVRVETAGDRPRWHVVANP